MQTDCKELSNKICEPTFNMKIGTAGNKEFKLTTILTVLVECTKGIDDLVPTDFCIFIKLSASCHVLRGQFRTMELSELIA
jgi:hypothetical protein